LRIGKFKATRRMDDPEMKWTVEGVEMARLRRGTTESMADYLRGLHSMNAV